MANVKGLVERISKNDAGFYSVKLGGEYFGAGKYAPKFNEGDEVSFEYTENGKYKNLSFGTVKVLEEAAKVAQAGGGTTNMSKGTDWDMKDKRITFLACRKDAIELIKIAASQDALTLPTKKADKLESIMKLVDVMADELYLGVYDSPFKEETND